MCVYLGLVERSCVYEFVCVVQGHGRLEAYLLGLCNCSFREGHVRLIYVGKWVCVLLTER